LTTASAVREPGLPRTVAGLPREERILWSMIRALAEKGIEAVTVGDVIRRAGVSRAGFYELFENLEDCLFAAYERLIEALVAHVSRAYEGDGPWPWRLRRALRALLEAFAAEPEVARMASIDLPASEPEAQRRYHDGMRRFVPLFVEGREWAYDAGNLSPDLELMTVASTEAVISRHVAADRTDELPLLLPDLLLTALVHYIGPEAATVEVRRTEDG
jgi:AcrR family transcriptional regulator